MKDAHPCRPNDAKPEPSPERLADVASALEGLFIAGDHFKRSFAAYLELGIASASVVTHLSLEGLLTPSQLATCVGVTPSAITSTLDKLEVRGLVERVKHPTDRRKVAITLTSAGTAANLQAATHLAAAVATPDADALAQTCEIIDRIAALLRQNLIVTEEQSLST